MANPRDLDTTALKRALLLQSRSRIHTTQPEPRPAPAEQQTAKQTAAAEKLQRPEKKQRPEKLKTEEEKEDEWLERATTRLPTFVAAHFDRAPTGAGRFSLTRPLTHAQATGETKVRHHAQVAPIAKRTNTLIVKVSPFEDDLVRRAAFSAGFQSIASFVRATLLTEVARMENAGKITVPSTLNLPDDVSVKDFVKKDRAQRRKV